VHVFVGGSGPDGRDLTWLREKLAGDVFALVSDEEVVLEEAGGVLSVRDVRLEEGRRGLRLVYWFEVGSGRTANPITAKLMEVRTIITGEHKRPAMVVVAVDTNGLVQSGASLHAIAAEVAAPISACLQSGPGENRQCKTLSAAAD
jgi:EpsI family protein